MQEEADRLLRELHGTPASTPAVQQRPSSAPDPGGVAGRSFAELYGGAGIDTTPYSAEQLLTVIERLRAMPRDQILIAVEAMDAADDRWNIHDVLLDAQRKQAALQQAIDGIDAQERASIEDGRTAREQLDRQVKEAEAEVDRQIAALRAQLADIQKTAEVERTAIDRKVAEARGVSEGERSRLADEMKRLRYVTNFFQTGAGTPGVR